LIRRRARHATRDDGEQGRITLGIGEHLIRQALGMIQREIDVMIHVLRVRRKRQSPGFRQHVIPSSMLATIRDLQRQLACLSKKQKPAAAASDNSKAVAPAQRSHRWIPVHATLRSRPLTLSCFLSRSRLAGSSSALILEVAAIISVSKCKQLAEIQQTTHMQGSNSRAILHANSVQRRCTCQRTVHENAETPG